MAEKPTPVSGLDEGMATAIEQETPPQLKLMLGSLRLPLAMATCHAEWLAILW